MVDNKPKSKHFSITQVSTFLSSLVHLLHPQTH